MLNPKVGQKCVRVIGACPIWANRDEAQGEVTAVDETTVTAEIMVDVTRIMKFDRKTSTNILGIDYGWIELK